MLRENKADDKIICPRCGTENDPGTKICVNCKYDLTQITEEGKEEKGKEKKRSKRKRKKGKSKL